MISNVKIKNLRVDEKHPDIIKKSIHFDLLEISNSMTHFQKYGK